MAFFSRYFSAHTVSPNGDPSHTQTTGAGEDPSHTQTISPGEDPSHTQTTGAGGNPSRALTTSPGGVLSHAITTGSGGNPSRAKIHPYPAKPMHILLLAFILLFSFHSLAISQTLTIYSGRSKALVEPLVNRFEETHGIRVNMRYGSSTQLAVALMEERRRTPADLFWAQDAGALGAVHREQLFQPLPQDLLLKLPDPLHNSDGTWIATSGRARVLAYSTTRVQPQTLPASVYELTDSRWRGRVGWAPSNGSFQSFLTSMRYLEGDEKTLQWLNAMKNNDAQSYINNSALLQAVAAGEIDLALTNHYYLFRFRESNPSFPVDQTYFSEGDPGNLVNVAGIGLLQNTRNRDAALAFIHFLLEEENQRWITEQVYEYPVLIDLIQPSAGGLAADQNHPVQQARLQEVQQLSPPMDLDNLSDLSQTLNLLRRAGLL